MFIGSRGNRGDWSARKSTQNHLGGGWLPSRSASSIDFWERRRVLAPMRLRGVEKGPLVIREGGTQYGMADQGHLPRGVQLRLRVSVQHERIPDARLLRGIDRGPDQG